MAIQLENVSAGVTLTIDDDGDYASGTLCTTTIAAFATGHLHGHPRVRSRIYLRVSTTASAGAGYTIREAPPQTTWTSTNVPRSITDYTTTYSTLAVAGGPTWISKVTVKLSITHTFDGGPRHLPPRPRWNLGRAEHRQRQWGRQLHEHDLRRCGRDGDHGRQPPVYRDVPARGAPVVAERARTRTAPGSSRSPTTPAATRARSRAGASRCADPPRTRGTAGPRRAAGGAVASPSAAAARGPAGDTARGGRSSERSAWSSARSRARTASTGSSPVNRASSRNAAPGSARASSSL